MSRRLEAFARPAAKPSARRSVGTSVLGLLGLLPVGFVSGFMLMQIFRL